jgi:hypothetical protein
MAQPQAAPKPADDEQNQDAKREQSKISFPYDDLDGAAAIARAIHELHGSECQTEQIAAHLKQSPKSSSFRAQVSSAKVFALVSGGQGTVALTKLGSFICDQQQEKAARVDAFLAVELYKAIYEKFKGIALPPDNGLEAAMVTLGVARKQKERARQVFKRSAQQAGFFHFGNDRLVLPAIKASAAAAAAIIPEGANENKQPPDNSERRNGGGGSDGTGHHPFIQGLLKKLPQADTEWPMDARSKWLEAAIRIFDLMYTDSDDGRRSITIELKKDSAK